MIKKYYTFIVLICTVTFLVSSTACTIKQSENEVEQTIMPNSQNSVHQVEPITFEILKSGAFPEYPADGEPAKSDLLQKALKQGMNLNFNVTHVLGANLSDKLNLLAASDQLPDYFSIDMTLMASFADQELIAKLDTYIDKNMPNAKKYFNQYELETIKYKDALYAFPVGYRPELVNGPNTNGLVIREDWLEVLKLEKPESLDELYNVMKAFTYNDPDRNGKNDTFGITAPKTEKFNYIFGAYGIIPDYWVNKDGKLVKGFTLPEMKDALLVLQKWYKEGIIDPDCIIQQAKASEQKFINGRAGIYHTTIFAVGPKTSPVYTALQKASDNSAKLIMLVPPKGPDGKCGFPDVPRGFSNIHSMSVKCKDPDLWTKFLDWTVDESENGGFWTLTYGVEGEHYTYDKNENKINLMVDWNQLYSEGYCNPIRFLQLVDRRWVETESIEAANITNNPENIITNAYWGTVPAVNDYPDIPKLYDEYFYKIISGNLPVGAWDEYIQKYYAQGGKQIEEQTNEAYNNIKK